MEVPCFLNMKGKKRAQVWEAACKAERAVTLGAGTWKSWSSSI